MAKLTPLASQMANKIVGAAPGSPYYGLPGTTLTPYHPPKPSSGGATPGGGYTPPPASPLPPAAPAAPAAPAFGPLVPHPGGGNPTAPGTSSTAALAGAIVGGDSGAHPGGPGQGGTAPHPNFPYTYTGGASGGTFASPEQMSQIAQAAITPGAGQVYDAAVGGVRPAGIPQGATIGLDPGDYTPGGLAVGTGGYSGAGNWQMNEPNVGDNLAYSNLQNGQNVPVLDLTTGQYVNMGSIVPGYNPAVGYNVGAVNARPAPQVPSAGNPQGP